MIRMEYDNTTQAGDLAQTSGKLVDDDGLETAVLISLFTDRRADEGDGADEGDLRGWWGDGYPDVQGDRTGSKLWLCFGRKTTAETRTTAIRYAEDALTWMIEDGVASQVQVTASWLQEGALKIGLLLGVAIYKPGDVAPRWQKTWELYQDGL